jgi:tetratricopeptide (TPR) repeat protein
LAITYATLGENKKALEAVRKVIEIDPDDGVALYNCAGAYACLGMRDEVLNILEKSLERGMWTHLEWIKVDPSLGSIRRDPKFKEIFSKYNI